MHEVVMTIGGDCNNPIESHTKLLSATCGYPLHERTTKQRMWWTMKAMAHPDEPQTQQ
jgi:hypothetical protein